jgi:hypothetical protein
MEIPRAASVEEAESLQDAGLQRSARAEEIANRRITAEESAQALSARRRRIAKSAGIGLALLVAFGAGRYTTGSGGSNNAGVPTESHEIDGWNIECIGDTPATIPVGGSFGDSVARYVRIEQAAPKVPEDGEETSTTQEPLSTEPLPQLPFDVVVQAQANQNDLKDMNNVQPNRLYHFSTSCAPVFDN